MPHLPPALLDRMLAFCAAKRTGQLVLHVHQGRVTAYAFTETGAVQDCATAAAIERDGTGSDVPPYGLQGN